MDTLNIPTTLFLTTMLDAVIIVDEAGNIIEFNPAAETTFGHKRQDIMGQSMIDKLVPAPYREAYRVGINLYLSVEQGPRLNRRIETIGLRGDGSEFPAELAITPIQSEEKVLFVAYVRDISQHKQAEAMIELQQENLMRNEERAQAILNNNSDAILLLADDCTIQQANPAFNRLFGYEVDELFSRSAIILISDKDHNAFEEGVLALLEQNQPQHLELQVRRNDGKSFPADIALSKVHSTRTSYSGIICSIRDITELKRTQSVLAEERNLLRTLIDTVPDYIYIKDKDHKFLLSNIAHAKARGCGSPDEIIGKTDADFFSSKLAAEFKAEEEAMFQTGKPLVNHEQQSKGYAGGFAWASSTKIPFKNLEGELIGLVGITRDITERKYMEERERTIAKGLKAVVEATDELITIHDLNTFYRRAVELAREKLYLERSSILLFDPTKEYLIGTYGTNNHYQTTDERRLLVPSRERLDLTNQLMKTWWVSQRQESTRALDEAILGEDHNWLATTIIRSGNEPIGIFSNDSAISGAPVDAVQQESLAVYCSLLGNLIERKRTEENLQLATSRLGNLLENLDAGILLEDENRRAVRVNQTFCDLFSIAEPPEMMIGMDCSGNGSQNKHMFVDSERFVSRIGELVKSQQKVTGENLLLNDGRVFERDYVPILLGGRYLGHLWQYRDSTEMIHARQRQQRLMEMEHLQGQIADLFLHADDLQRVMDKVLKLVGETLDLSRVYVAHFRKNERLMDTTLEWCAPGVASELGNNQGVPYNEIFPSLYPMLMKDGIIAPRHISDLPEDMRSFLQLRGFHAVLILPIYTAGRLEGLIGLADYRRDREWLPEKITSIRAIADGYARFLERKQAETSLIEARDAALRTAHIKSEFMSNMSHEIRTPMTGVLGMLELLIEMDLDEMAHQFADDAYQSAKRLLKIINDILDFSKIEAGHMVLNQESVDLRGVIHEVAMLLTPIAISNGVQLTEEIADNVPERVISDATRLGQILTNLVGNAVKFTRQGSVCIRLSTLSQAENHIRLRFEVQDTGIGIDVGQLDHIFESFVQADGTSTRKFGGTGLGLAISKQLVELMEGEIEVQSELNIGSTFSFVLSLPLVSHQTDFQTGRSLLSQLRILIYDEDNSARFILAQQLRVWGVEVVEIDHHEKLESIIMDTILQGDQFDLALIHSTILLAEALALYLRNAVPEHVINLLVRIDEPNQTQDLEHSAFDAHLLRPIRQSDLYNLFLKASEISRLDGDDQLPQPVHTIAGSVLLAEDNEINQNIVVRALKSVGYKVDIAQNGQEALDMLEKFPYDVVLMDIHMPVMDGKMATKMIRDSQKRYHNIPIIAVTASALSEEQDEYLSIGMNEVLAKPFSLAELRLVVTKWVKRSDTLLPDSEVPEY